MPRILLHAAVTDPHMPDRTYQYLHPSRTHLKEFERTDDALVWQVHGELRRPNIASAKQAEAPCIPAGAPCYISDPILLPLLPLFEYIFGYL